MTRAKKQTVESVGDAYEGPDVFDQAIADRHDQATRQAEAAQVVKDVAAATAMPPEAGRPAPQASHAATVERKKYVPPVDPFGFENIKAGESRVRLFKSEAEGAWVIRFAHNPNEDKGPNGETYSKTNPHPVLKMLKDEGFRWGFDRNDGLGGWGKPFSGDAYGTEHMEARRVL